MVADIVTEPKLEFKRTTAVEVKPIEGSEERTANIREGKCPKGVYLSIFLAAAFPCLIIFLVSGLLLGITLKNKKTLGESYPELNLIGTGSKSSSLLKKAADFENTGGSAAFFIDFSPTSLTTIASWTSKLIPYMSSSMMGLAAIFAADHIRKASQAGKGHKLLTPHEMTMLLGLLASEMEQMWETLTYQAKPGTRLRRPIPFVFWLLVFTTLLGLVIPAVDTWFGVTVKASDQTIFTAQSPTRYASGCGLRPMCTDKATQLDPTGHYLPCNIQPRQSGAALYTLASNDEAMKTYENVSDTYTVVQVPNQTDIWFLADAYSDETVDFKARTYAISTKCQPITLECGIEAQKINEKEGEFNCTKLFTSNIQWSGAAGTKYNQSCSSSSSSSSPVGIQFFGDAGLTTNFSPDPESYFSAQNPVYFGTWASGQTASSIQNDSQVQSGILSGGAAWMLNCSSTVYDATYLWVDGAASSFNMTLSNDTVGGIFAAALVAGFASVPLQEAAILGGFEPTSQNLSDVTASEISQTSLALAVGALMSMKNELEQSREKLTLTRVPLVPFYVLIALKLSYALTVIVLAIAAVCWANPAASHEIKARLSIKGLAAASFETDKFKNQAVKDLKGIPVCEDHNGGISEKDHERKTVVVAETTEGSWKYVTTAITALHDGEAVTNLVKAVVKG